MSSEAPAPVTVQVDASNPTTAAAVVTSQQGATINSSTSIGSLADLKRKSPTLYNAMMQGIGMSICNRMKDNQDHLKQMMDDYNRNS